MRFQFTQAIAVPHHKVAAFFSDVQNLRRITPAFPRMEITAPTTVVVKGAEFLLCLDFGLFTLRWVSVIDAVDKDRCFTDTFRGSLFRTWRHTHRYEPHGGGTFLTDEIDCEPVWWLKPVLWPAVHLLFLYRGIAIRSAFR